MPSKRKVNPMVQSRREWMPLTSSTPYASISTNSLCTLRRRPTSTSRKVPNVVIPRPPSWMSVRTTNWPKRVSSEPISMTESPVTHVALVAVKSAATGANPLPLVLAAGSVSRNVPIRMANRNPKAISHCGLRCWVVGSFFAGFLMTGCGTTQGHEADRACPPARALSGRARKKCFNLRTFGRAGQF